MSPIFALFTPRPRSLATLCQDAGFLVRPIVSPTVQRGTERVRVCLHAGNTRQQIEGLVACVKVWVGKEVEANNVKLNKNMKLHDINGLEAMGNGDKAPTAKL